MIDQYQRLIGDARLAIYDGMVKGVAFAKTIDEVVYLATTFGERQAHDMAMSVTQLSPDSVHFELTENASADYADLRAMLVCEALGKLFGGDMNGMVTFVVDSGIRFGIAVERMKIARSAPNVADMFEAIVANMKLLGIDQVPDEPATALFETLKHEKPEVAIYYTKRLLVEEKLSVNANIEAFRSLFANYRYLLS